MEPKLVLDGCGPLSEYLTLQAKLLTFMSELSRFAHCGSHLQMDEVPTPPFTPLKQQ
jgi:hypothetical protein